MGGKRKKNGNKRGAGKGLCVRVVFVFLCLVCMYAFTEHQWVCVNRCMCSAGNYGGGLRA